MKKLAMWTLAITGVMMMVLPAMAAQPAAKKEASLKIGVLDTVKIMRESKAAKSARAVFLKDLEAKRGILAAKEKEVRLLDEELKGAVAKLSPEARRNKSDKMAQEVKELNRLKTDLEEELKKKDMEMTKKLLGEIRGVVSSFSKNESYSLILEKNAVIVSDDAIDITDRIIQLYDGQKK